MIEAWLLSKLGKVWFGILKWLAIILICASPFIYHFYVVGDLKKNLHESQEKTLILEKNVGILKETNENNQKTIDFIKENQIFIQKLEVEYSARAKARAAEKQAFNNQVAQDAKRLGDKPLTPLLASALNNLNAKTKNSQTMENAGGAKDEENSSGPAEGQ